MISHLLCSNIAVNVIFFSFLLLFYFFAFISFYECVFVYFVYDFHVNNNNNSCDRYFLQGSAVTQTAMQGGSSIQRLIANIL